MTAAEQRPDEERPAWVPDFPGQRPPFQPGHTLSMKHGAWSQRMVDPIAAAFVSQVQADPTLGYLAAPRFAAALQAWAAAEAKRTLLQQWVDKLGIEQAADAGALELLRKWDVNAANHRDKLGLSPVSAARLSKDIAAAQQSADVAAVMAELHRQAQERGE